MTLPRRLLDAAGQPVPRQDILRAKMRAQLNVPAGFPGTWQRGEGGHGEGIASPWPWDGAAWYSQDFGNWFPYIQSPDAENDLDRDRMVARTRDLARNDGWARGILESMADSTVGAHFFPIPAPNWRVLARLDPRLDSVWAEEFSSAVAAEWTLWADDPNRWCDASRTVTFTQMLRLAFLHKIRDGDALAVTLWDPGAIGEGGAHYATRIQLIDPDRLSNPDEMIDQDRMRNGVEIDSLGAPVAYWIRRAEPNDWWHAALSMVWDRFPRETAWGRPIVVHDFPRDRAAQHRGVGLLLPVMARFKMLSRFDQVSLQRAVMQSLLGLWVKSPYDGDMVQQALATEGESLGVYQGMRGAYHSEKAPLMLGGMRLPQLFSGESIETVKADSTLSEFQVFEHAVLRSIAAATGMSAEEVSRDYSKTNYSSARAAMLVAWKTLLRRRGEFASGFATPLYGAWLEEAIDLGRVPVPASAPAFADWRAAYARCRWIGPGRGWVDPMKERQGEVLGLDAGFSTLQSVCAEIGGADYRDVLEQRAREVAEMKRLGLSMPDWAGGSALPANKQMRPA